ncbi:hypothetical protein GCM10009759_20270 [Kitasatospora saccharophila]|uniref:Uncharacterized protein n=1 Tax=Kitasatospora saccharophila TaxID=407973 RepID=A0ABP5I771_9ACTN
MSRCHSTYSGVAALDSTKTAVIGQAASHTHRNGASPPPPPPPPSALLLAGLLTVLFAALPAVLLAGLIPVPDMGVPPDLPVGSRQYESSRT